MEVSHHLGKQYGTLHYAERKRGLQRDREVIATGSGIKVPVGDKNTGTFI